jgi:hypothetical protein
MTVVVVIGIVIAALAAFEVVFTRDREPWITAGH